ncbi:hypothetical protein HDU84_005675 [Entophlyctis sp. JEL0112]|nr:hypothetical protein HDU84_005675 [Entophlyctis sp. JEL0112]
MAGTLAAPSSIRVQQPSLFRVIVTIWSKARYGDFSVACKIGVFLAEKSILNLAAQWLKISSDNGNAQGMLEYAKFLLSPGWASHLAVSSPASQNAKNGKNDQTENSIDAGLALSLLLASFQTDASAEAAFWIGMIYTESPTQAIQPRPRLRKRSSSASEANSSSSNFSTASMDAGTQSKELSVFKDIARARAWFERAVQISEFFEVEYGSRDGIATKARFQLARLSLMGLSIDEHVGAIVRLRRLAACTSESQEPKTAQAYVIGILALQLLGACSICGVGSPSLKSQPEEGESHMQAANAKMVALANNTNREHLTANALKALVGSSTDAKVLFSRVFGQLRLLAYEEDHSMISPWIMLAFGTCYQLGIGHTVDVVKSEYWINRANAVKFPPKEFLSTSREKDVEAELGEIFADSALLEEEASAVYVSPVVPCQYDTRTVIETVKTPIATLPELPKFKTKNEEININYPIFRSQLPLTEEIICYRS